MYRSIKKIFGVAVSALVVLCTAVTAFAAEELTLDSQTQLAPGDTFKYTLCLSDCTESVVGVQMYVFYDKEYLQLDPELEFNTIEGANYNTNLDSFLTFNWASPMSANAVDYSDKADLVSMNFTVLKEGNTEISYFIKQLYGEQNEYLKAYKLSYDISVDGESIASDLTPAVYSDLDFINANKFQGDFINYIDGMGEENTPNKDDHPAIIGERPTLPVSNANSSSADYTADAKTIIIVVVIVLILCAAIAVIIVKKKDNGELQK